MYVLSASWALLFLSWSISVSASGTQVNGATGAINDTVPTSTENEATIYTIMVGKEKNTYIPNSINPGPGDIVSFVFLQGNHSVIKAEYGYPCVPYEDLEGNEGRGFYSGDFSVTQEQVDNGDTPVWNLTVNTTTPTFFYCGLAGGCTGWGMVGALNADAEHSIAKQIEVARQAEYMLKPGQPLPAEISTSMASLAASATTVTVLALPKSSSGLTTSSAAMASATGGSSKQKNQDSDSLSSTAIVGVVMGGIALLALAVICGRSKVLSEQLRREKEPQLGPDDRNSRKMSTQSTDLPPYTYFTPRRYVDHNTARLVEADSTASNRRESGSLVAISPEAHSPEIPRRDYFQQTHTAAQHASPRVFQGSDPLARDSAWYAPKPPHTPVVHEMEALHAPWDHKDSPQGDSLV